MTDESQANPTREPSQSFREATEARLQQEHEAKFGQPESRDDTSPTAELGDEEAAEREPEEVEAEESEQDHPEADTEAEASDEDIEPDSEWTAREAEWSEKVEKAEEARKSMERDYRHKTHKLSENVRAVESEAQEVKQTAEYYNNLAQAELQRFQSINWQQLQTQPEQYQQAQQAWMQANQVAQQRKQELEMITKRAEEMSRKNQDRLAEHSRGVLMHQIPSWGGDVYNELREFAEKEYDYSGEEFDKIVDWRPMKMLYDAKQAANVRAESVNVVKKIGKKRGRKAPGRTADGQPRNQRGQFQKARDEAFSNPGDKQRTRDYFKKRLERERGRQ